jgi:uncharacterized cupin superfamily protein
MPVHARDYNRENDAMEMAMATPAIVDFRRNIKGEESAPAADKVVKGEPKTVVKNYFSDPSGQFFAGTWASSVGKWKIQYSENEFCHLLEGRVVITSEEGKRWQFNAGDAWVIPAGFSGTWETVEPARKRYAVFEATKPSA